MPADAFVSWPSSYLTFLVTKALQSSALDFRIYPVYSETIPQKLLQWASYDFIDHEKTALNPDHVIASSYIFRKALIRKHFLSNIIRAYCKKNTKSVLATSWPVTYEMEISFVDELDELFSDDLWELSESLEHSKKWWILKPSMADRGNGIRLFNSKGMLEDTLQIFEEDDEGEIEDMALHNTNIVTSQLRHFVIQEYIEFPLLMDPYQVLIGDKQISNANDSKGYKFHLRAYCVAQGALTLFLYDRILALFSSKPYQKPSEDDGTSMDLSPHLTNTSLQTHRGEEGVRLLEELVGCDVVSLPGRKFNPQDVVDIIRQISDTLTETFKAALANPIHFQAIPNAFELFGVDFLVEQRDGKLSVKLLEINAEPAIELTGPRLSWILEALFVRMRETCVEPFFSEDSGNRWDEGVTRNHFLKCFETQIRGSEKIL